MARIFSRSTPLEDRQQRVGAHGGVEDVAELVAQALVVGVGQQTNLAAGVRRVEHLGRVAQLIELLELLGELAADRGALLFDLLAQRLDLGVGGVFLFLDRGVGDQLDVGAAAVEVLFLRRDVLLHRSAFRASTCFSVTTSPAGTMTAPSNSTASFALQRADVLGQLLLQLDGRLHQRVGGCQALLLQRLQLGFAALSQLLDLGVALASRRSSSISAHSFSRVACSFSISSCRCSRARFFAGSSTWVMMYCAK